MAEVLALLEQLIACASVTPRDAGCQDLIAERLQAAGFTVNRMPFGDVSNLWATHGSGEPVLCFAGHTDVVPPGPPEAWTTPPFTPTLQNGLLRGRGAQDMKAGVAAMVVACERLARAGHAGTVALLLTSDEEGAAINGTRAVLEALTARGVAIDAALVGEPTSSSVLGDKIKIGRRGSISVRLEATGVQGHTAYAHLAANASHPLVVSLARILALDWGGPTAEFPATSLQVTHLGTGTSTPNVIPGSATAELNLRYGTNWSADSIQQRLESALDPGIRMSVSIGARPFLTQHGSLVEILEQAISEEFGHRPERATDGGTSDARFFAEFGVPVVEFGTRNNTIHAINEAVDILELEPLARVFERWATRMASATAASQ